MKDESSCPISEASIRDWLAQNLGLIEPGLKLIKTEFYLNDIIGAKGYIDILCQDTYNNFVIIELKRSNSSSRQTLTEVLKYHALIKHSFRARDGEIRVIIVSTHWHELIRAFSETFFRTTIAIKGFKIELDPDTRAPKSITKVEPVKAYSQSRKFAFWQGLYLFRTLQKQKKFHFILQQKLSKINYSDYVILDLDAPSENKRIITPFATVIAFQRQSCDVLIDMMNKLKYKTAYVMNREDFDDEKSYHTHLEGAFIDALAMSVYDDDAESGYSEKLHGMIGSQGWNIRNIYRNGIFNIDPRYGDKLLIKEMCGLDGNSRNKYIALADSSQIERLQEIKSECVNSLAHTPQWLNIITEALHEAIMSNSNFRVILDIYNPDSVITAFYFTISKANPNYLPTYTLIIDYFDEQRTIIYKGEVCWNRKEPSQKLFFASDNETISNEVFRAVVDPDNIEDAKAMGLSYISRKIAIIGDLEDSNFVESGAKGICIDTCLYKPLQEYIISYQPQIMTFLRNYNSAYREM